MQYRLAIALLAVVAVAGGGGCRSVPKHPEAITFAPVHSEQLNLLSPEHHLVIKVEENPPKLPSRITLFRTVQADGTVALESNKVFTATGKTIGEFRREVRDYYVPKRFKSVVIVNDDYPIFWSVGGAVRRPCQQISEGPIPLLDAIAAAGGFTSSADKEKVQLISLDGERRVINCTNTQREPEPNVDVLRGDYIYVPRLSKWPFW